MGCFQQLREDGLRAISHFSSGDLRFQPIRSWSRSPVGQDDLSPKMLGRGPVVPTLTFVANFRFLLIAGDERSNGNGPKKAKCSNPLVVRLSDTMSRDVDSRHRF
ncbi:hypothetical protein CEXT_236371 [Caerostris extrusa]|uniref:Uncharacterized protein n=1 Tax=Caerostris extrusa TaxID=172846 RepID=A0AAV4RYV5_CAEEX|nr:hypothetical protein CEXT_236371 [Caerostris extrusa]